MERTLIVTSRENAEQEVTKLRRHGWKVVSMRDLNERNVAIKAKRKVENVNR